MIVQNGEYFALCTYLCYWPPLFTWYSLETQITLRLGLTLTQKKALKIFWTKIIVLVHYSGNFKLWCKLGLSIKYRFACKSPILSLWCFWLLFTVIPKDYWVRKNFQDMGPLSVNSIHIRRLLFEKNKIF